MESSSKYWRHALDSLTEYIDLRILQVHSTSDSSIGKSSTPTVDTHPAKKASPPPRNIGQVLGKGNGGVTVSEVVNLWKGSWAVGKSVTDVDWGVGGKLVTISIVIGVVMLNENGLAMENKIVTASPNGNFMIFDVIRGKFGKLLKEG